MAELHEAEIRARIKAARREAGLSQDEFAQLLEVIPRTVQNYENHHVPWGRIKDIAEITGVSTAWILHGDAVQEARNEPEDKLDRIDRQLISVSAQLDQLASLLNRQEDRAAEAARAVDQATTELLEAAGLLHARAPAPRRRTPVDKQRKSA